MRRTYLLVPRTVRRSRPQPQEPSPRERRVPLPTAPDHEPPRKDPREQPRRVEELEHDGTRPIGPDERDDQF